MSINFSALSHRSLLGRLLRRIIGLIPHGTRVRVLQGPLRGAHWIVGASTHGCWLGSYEADKQRRFVAAVEPGHTVIDVGAHVGFYTVLAARQVGRQGTVVAIEPSEVNLAHLRRHVALNDCSGVTVIPAAAGRSDGKVHFSDGTHASMGRIDEQGTQIVPLRSLDSLKSELALQRVHVMKIDVEGAEAEVLRGAAQLLADDRPIIFLATHGTAVMKECAEVLQARGYDLRPLDDRCAPESADEFIALPVG